MIYERDPAIAVFENPGQKRLISCWHYPKKFQNRPLSFLR